MPEVVISADSVPVGSVWEPTRDLRYILPDAHSDADRPILQRKWIERGNGRIEWRTVPLEIVPYSEYVVALREAEGAQ